MIELLSDQGLGCHLHDQFAGAFVFPDVIHNIVGSNKHGIELYVRNMFHFAAAFDLRFDSSKTKCMYFSKNNKDKNDNICFMNTSIDFMECSKLLDVHISNDIANRNISSIIHKFYGKANSIMYDFRNVPCHVKAKLLR